MNPDAKKRYNDINFPFTCPITKRTFLCAKGLSCYVTKGLKANHEEYYDKYINHRDNSCFFCGRKGKFISISKEYRNLCENSDCVKKSFSSHSVEGFMYRNGITREEAEVQFSEENRRQLDNRLKTQKKLRESDPNWDKKRSRNCVEFWINKGLSREEAEIEVSKVMSEIHQKTSQKLKSNPKKYASKYPTKKEYYLERGFTEEEAIEKISEIQNRFSLEKCIEKFGNEQGSLIFQNRQIKWQNSLKENGNIKGGYSKISQVLFRELVESCYENRELKNVFFWTKNGEFSIKYDKSIFLYDFVDIKRKKIIEYNGDQYHANPAIYEEHDTPHPFHKTHNWTSKKIWSRDKLKIDLAENNGFSVLVIWDSEYRKNPQQTIEKCIKFIND
jgi:hypothetical protein